MRSFFRGVLFLLALFSAACDGTITVTFQTGPQEFSVETDDLALPDELRDGDLIATLDCAPTGLCPASDVVTLSCEAGVCDPAPRTVSASGGVIDVDALLAETREVGLRVVDAYEVLEVRYDVQQSSLTVPTEPLEIFWGPGSAAGIDPELGVRPFGTVPAIGAGETPEGLVDLDDAGVLELSDYLVEREAQVRFFARTRVDLEPGDPFPEGSLRVSVNATLRAVGSLVD
jgi:hypothetical protein